MPILLLERPCISVGDVEIVGVNFTDHLNAGETLVSATVEELTTDDLTITDVMVNPEAYTEWDTQDLVAVGKAVSFVILSLTAGVYNLRVTVETIPVDTTAYQPVSRQFVRDLWLQFK